MWNMDSTENLANAPFAEFIYGCKVTESLWEATWIHLTSAPSLLWKTNFFGHPTCSAMFFYQQDHRELRYSQSHLEGDRPRNTAKREERHLKLFVSKKTMKKLCQRKKKELHLWAFTFKTNPNRPVSMYVHPEMFHPFVNANAFNWFDFVFM